MDILVLTIAVVVAAGAAVGGYLFAVRRSAADEARRVADQAATTESLQLAIDAAVQHAVAEVRDRSTAERDAAVQAALEQTAILQREQFGAMALAAREQTTSELSSKKDVIDARLDQVHTEMRAELTKLSEMVTTLGRSSAENFGQVTSSLQAHAEIATTLADSTRALREALANPQARGNWGERMAEDVLRLAGFHENVNYVKQTQIDGGTGRPDYTFPMPKGHALYMDVKFPMASYLRYLEVDTNAEREVHLKRFLADVRLRVKELSKRDYANESEQPSVDYVLLFIPNEQLTGFIHEHDAALLDEAMGQKVVLCSPLTLFAFLGVIRQAFDNFMIEQTSDEILQLLGTFSTQWRKYNDQVDSVKKKFDQVDRAFEQLSGPRRRQLEKPLRQLDELRLARNLPVDGELFAATDTGAADDDTETPPGGTIRMLGA
ncbi:MAG TPA: DNA recombination protein RmuC [Ilumatobacteraceae bacterium]|jgi:DNA recombination protein RmuC|nr:DNA recombination protein RmuC [Ilumatobacteraceae bacterium]